MRNVKLLVVMGWAVKSKKKRPEDATVYSGAFQAVDLSHPVSVLDSFYLKTDLNGVVGISTRSYRFKNPDLTLFTAGEPNEKGEIFWNYNHRYQLIDAVVDTETFNDRKTGLRTPVDVIKQFKPSIITTDELFGIINSNHQFNNSAPIVGLNGNYSAATAALVDEL